MTAARAGAASMRDCRAISTLTWFARIPLIPTSYMRAWSKASGSVWIAARHWQDLRLGMPPTAIHDLRVQPREHDLIAGTHGRGLWILDDLTPIERISKVEAARQPTLFPVRTAYSWYLWWAGGYGTHDDECCVPSGEIAGDDPPYGALITYYLPQRSASPVVIDVLDAAGAHGTHDARPRGCGSSSRRVGSWKPSAGAVAARARLEPRTPTQAPPSCRGPIVCGCVRERAFFRNRLP